jgi:hypothetical protein
MKWRSNMHGNGGPNMKKRHLEEKKRKWQNHKRKQKRKRGSPKTENDRENPGKIYTESFGKYNLERLMH